MLGRGRRRFRASRRSPLLERRTIRLGLDVVGAADRHEQRVLAVRLRARRRAAAVPRLEVDAVAQHRQAGQAARQIEQAGTLTVRGVQRQHFMLQAAQDRADHPGQAGAGADFQEGAHAGAEQVLDLGHPFDRPRQLAGQEVAGLGRRRPGTAPPWCWRTPARRRDASRSFSSAARNAGSAAATCGLWNAAATDRRVARTCRAWNAAAARSTSAAGPESTVCCGAFLFARYEVDFLFCQDLRNGFGRCVDREHSAGLVAGRGRHQPAALQRQSMQVFGADPAGGAQGDQFAVAVAGEGVAADAERLQHAPRPQAHGAQRRLGRRRWRAERPRWRPAPPA